jgi:hypothetical protein
VRSAAGLAVRLGRPPGGVRLGRPPGGRPLGPSARGRPPSVGRLGRSSGHTRTTSFGRDFPERRPM